MFKRGAVIIQWAEWMVLNFGRVVLVSNETNTDVRMYIEEFILVDITIHCCTKLK